ncbi:MAG: alpha/beta fold hydrolase [Actinomycetales bacterium]
MSRSVRRIVLTAILTTCLAAGAQLTPAWADDAGRVIEAAGQRQWIRCQGSQVNGSPTVVLVSGLRADHTMWSKVDQRLAALTRTCVVDRPGLGSSPPRKGSRRTDAGDHARELHAALQAAGESGPYLVIGHSYGGLIVRAFTRLFPEDVASVLLLDTVWPTIYRDFLPSYASPWHEGGTTVDLKTSATVIGADFNFGNRPLIVIAAGAPGNGSSWADRTWFRQQRRMATLSTDGELRVAKRSGHVIQQDQPAIVLRAVRALLADPGPTQAATRFTPDPR